MGGGIEREFRERARCSGEVCGESDAEGAELERGRGAKGDGLVTERCERRGMFEWIVDGDGWLF